MIFYGDEAMGDEYVCFHLPLTLVHFDFNISGKFMGKQVCENLVFDVAVEII